MRLIDISREISPSTAVWPGDRSFEWSWTLRQDEDASVNVGGMSLSTHTGSHVDAPLHVRAGGASTDSFELDSFVGPVEVVDVTEHAEIRPDHVPETSAERLLFKTAASALDAHEWPDSITPVAPDTVHHLAAHDITLIGTDAPSVDPLDSTALPAHHALVESGIRNLEGLSLAGVSPGSYFLVALPLKVNDADAAPVRAALADRPPFA